MFRVGGRGRRLLGLSVSVRVDQAAGAEDALVERDGARVAIDPARSAYLAGAKIDFVDDLMGQAFRIENPNAVLLLRLRHSFSM